MKITINMFDANNYYVRINWVKMVEFTIDNEPAAIYPMLHRTDGPAILAFELERNILDVNYFIEDRYVKRGGFDAQFPPE